MSWGRGTIHVWAQVVWLGGILLYASVSSYDDIKACLSSWDSTWSYTIAGTCFLVVYRGSFSKAGKCHWHLSQDNCRTTLSWVALYKLLNFSGLQFHPLKGNHYTQSLKPHVNPTLFMQFEENGYVRKKRKWRLGRSQRICTEHCGQAFLTSLCSNRDGLFLIVGFFLIFSEPKERRDGGLWLSHTQQDECGASLLGSKTHIALFSCT